MLVEEIIDAFAERYELHVETVSAAEENGSSRCRVRCGPTPPPSRSAMAVYTDVSAEELAEFLEGYDIGELLSYKGIAEGVENSNFLLHTSKGAFILTLYEKRVAVDDLPFFLVADDASGRARHASARSR